MVTKIYSYASFNVNAIMHWSLKFLKFNLNITENIKSKLEHGVITHLLAEVR